MGLTYKRVKEVDAAWGVIYKKGQPNIHPDKVKGRTYKLWHGAEIIYSQQQTIIKPLYYTGARRAYDTYDQYLPEGVTRVVYFGPYKEYVTFVDTQGVQRYYIVPTEGVRLVRKGKSYVCANPLVDYSIRVDRKKAADARKSAEDLLDYIKFIWNIQQLPEGWSSWTNRPYSPQQFMPELTDDREKWHEWLLAAKYAQYGAVSRDTVLQRVRDHFTRTALAYSVSVVPDTTTDHTSHWDKLPALRAAGLLKEFEDKNGYVKREPKRLRARSAGR